VALISGRSDYAIAAVSKLTGISCHALRVWERRYGFPVPERSATGHRRYDADQVRLLRLIGLRLRAGASIRDVMDALRAGRLGSEDGTDATQGCEGRLNPLLDRLMAGDLAAGEVEFACLMAGLDSAEQLDVALEPGMTEAGERFYRGACSLAQERCAGGFLRRKLDLLLAAAQRANTRPLGTVVLGTPEGDRHDGGMVMIGLLLELAGWRALVLGSDLPVQVFQEAIDAWRPDAVGVSFTLARSINKRFRELAKLVGAPVYVGGRSILNYQSVARRYALIPVPGPARIALGPFLAKLAQRDGRRTLREGLATG
jgi:methanogenic corrinoid protein MtbC1